MNIKDDKGAVMVLATFVAILLVGLVYHLAGLGAAALEQQMMQDGADATAFSAATACARGMNIIALINLIMAAVLSVLVALRLVQSVLVVAVGILTTCCIIPASAPVCCGPVAPTVQALARVTKAAERYEQNVVKKVLKGLNKAATGVNKAVPLLAEAEGVAISLSDAYSPPSKGGIVFPLMDQLPTKPGKYSTLCEKAGQMVMAPVAHILPGDLGKAADTVGDLIGEMSGSFSQYFCGEGDGTVPKKRMKNEVGYPAYDEQYRDQCSDVNSVPDDLGRCYTADCKQCASYGCQLCFRRLQRGEYKNILWTRITSKWIEWTDSDGHVKKSEIIGHGGDVWESVKTDSNPCQSGGSPFFNCELYTRPGGRWWRDPDPDFVFEPSDIPSVCKVENEQQLNSSENLRYGAQPGALLLQKTRKTYLILQGCVVEEDVTVEAQGEPIANSQEEKNKMSPRELDAQRYKKDSKLKSVLLGARGAGGRMKKVAFGTNSVVGPVLGKRTSFAAAEYFSSDEDDESMWKMNWRSRLILFRLGQDDSEELNDAAGGLEGFILH